MKFWFKLFHCFRGAARLEQLDPNLQLYWEEIGFQIPNPDPTDSPQTLLSKCSEILSHYFPFYNCNVQEPHTWLELANNLALANTATPAGIGAHPNLNLLTELLNPGSQLYMEGTRIWLSWNCGVGWFLFDFFSVCRSASKECHARAERKQSKGNSSIFLGGNPQMNIDPCLSCSTS